MKTLVVHPEDISTDFLSSVYSNTNFEIERTLQSSNKLKKKIKTSDRIIMLGHGSNYGLFGRIGMAIDSKLVYLLREKKCIFIWCNSNIFVEKYKLSGLYSGMIISEIEEAKYFNIIATQNEIDESNILFANALTVAIDSQNPIQAFKDYYNLDNPIVNFNKNNIFYR